MAEFHIPVKVTTSALTVASAVPAIVTARLAAGAANLTAYIHDTAGSTSASTQVAVLKALANTDTELSVPVRCKAGVKTVISAGSGTLHIYIR